MYIYKQKQKKKIRHTENVKRITEPTSRGQYAIVLCN